MFYARSTAKGHIRAKQNVLISTTVISGRNKMCFYHGNIRAKQDVLISTTVISGRNKMC